MSKKKTNQEEAIEDIAEATTEPTESVEDVVESATEPVEEPISPIADVIAVVEALIAEPASEDGMLDTDVVTYRLNSGKLAHGVKKGIIKLGYKPIEKYQK